MSASVAPRPAEVAWPLPSTRGCGLPSRPHVWPSSWAAWGPILYLTLAGSVVAFVTYAWLVNHWPLTRISFIAVIVPLVALLIGALVRHERLTAAGAAGSGLVLVGVVMSLAAGRPARR